VLASAERKYLMFDTGDDHIGSYHIVERGVELSPIGMEHGNWEEVISRGGPRRS
jgi:hypothetical protein